MYKVVLLGAAGQLGRLVSTRVPPATELHAFGSELDITNRAALRDRLSALNPDLIINTAAYTQVDKAESEPETAYAVNAAGPENIALAAPDETRIIHISTDFVFDGKNSSPYLPDDTPNPLSVYGASKLEGERRLQALRPATSLIIRTAWLYSANGRNFMNTMLSLMARRDELSVVADQRGTPTSAHTLADVIWHFSALSGELRSCFGVYHWTDKGECSWYDFACAIQQQALQVGLLEKEINILPVTTADYPTPAKRPAYSVLDKTSSDALLNFSGFDWQQSLRETLAIRNNGEQDRPERLL